jgi:tRNA G10  N-methylase Trm11
MVKENVDIRDDDLIIEPSAGNGSFIPSIKSITDNCRFYDIEPMHEEIKQMDYLEYKHNKTHSRVHIIGNPPFGRQSSLAIKFIKKSTEFCNSISFILPKSFKKDGLQRFFPLDYHLVYQEDVPNDSFLVDGKEYNVPCVFQIWIKRLYERQVKDKNIPKGFKFVKKDEDPDISFRRVGVNAGTITMDTDKSIQSHYFIKFTNNLSLMDNLDTLSYASFDFNNTVGPKSISKSEIIEKFNSLIGDFCNRPVV